MILLHYQSEPSTLAARRSPDWDIAYHGVIVETQLPEDLRVQAIQVQPCDRSVEHALIHLAGAEEQGRENEHAMPPRQPHALGSGRN